MPLWGWILALPITGMIAFFVIGDAVVGVHDVIHDGGLWGLGAVFLLPALIGLGYLFEHLPRRGVDR